MQHYNSSLLLDQKKTLFKKKEVLIADSSYTIFYHLLSVWRTGGVSKLY